LPTRHWIGFPQALAPGWKVYRYIRAVPRDAPAMQQVPLAVTPTRTTYRFQAGGACLDVAFFTPAFPQDPD